MTVDFDLVKWIGALVAPVLAYYVKAMNALRKELHEHKLHVAEHYATNSYVKDVDETMAARLDRIDAKLDRLIERGK